MERRKLARFFSAPLKISACAWSVDLVVTIGRIKVDDEPMAGPSW